MILNEKIFREYDIRGVVGKDFDSFVAYELGRSFADLVAEDNASLSRDQLTVAVGNDCRLSADEMREAVVRGLNDGGVNALITGMGPSPQLYFVNATENVHGAIQITASHNPGDQNGFKMMVGKRTLSGADIRAIGERIKTKKDPVDKKGTAKEINSRELYLKELIARSKDQMGSRKIKVVVDAGNGVGGLVGPDLLRALGCEVIELFTEPDGTFPNHHPDPTVLENIVELRKKVVELGADCGIGWDGDADRIGVIDEKGEPIYGDMLLVIYGRALLGELKNPTIIGDVKCSELLFSDLNSKGANAVMAKTGHSLIKAKMKELNAELAGEMSGHMFFAHRYFGFDDAIHASARFVEIISKTDKKVSELLSDLPKMYSTPEIRLDLPEEIKFKIPQLAQEAFSEYRVNTIDGVRVAFEKGWGLCRASNTQACLVMRFEAETPELLLEYQTLFEARIHKLISENS